MIKWGRQRERLDKYKSYEAFLWGAVAQLHPSRQIKRPLHPHFAREFDEGAEMARAGYLNMRPDSDPTEIVRRLKQEHRLKRAEIAASAA